MLLQREMAGPEVGQVQQKLAALGYYWGAVDGIFGRQTEQAVLDFQGANGLSVDGRVGPKTWGALFGTPETPRPQPVALKGFDRAVRFTLSDLIEGGYVNDPDDPGGETNFGISKRSHPNVDIRRLTKEGAIAIYRQAYWDSISGDEIAAISDDVAVILFDVAVNHGTGDAKAFLSDALKDQYGASGPNQWPTLIGLLRQAVSQQPDTDELEFRLILRRLLDYKDIMDKRAASRKYARGWLSRALLLFREVD